MKPISGFLSVFILTLILSGCAPIESNQVDDLSDPNSIEDVVTDAAMTDVGPQDIPSGWEVLDAGDFILYAPSDWVLEKGAGIDSSVGIVSNEAIDLEYDYGMYAGQFENNSDYEEDAYEARKVDLNGFDSIIYTSIGQDGYTVLNVIDPKGEGSSLNLYAKDLSDDQEALVVEIFGTIFFKQ